MGKKNFIVLCAVCVAALFLFVHPDAMETAAHGYLFLESLFTGAPRSFYGIVAQHQNDFYYLNNAHYNIVVYAIYAVVQLPVYLVCSLTGAAPGQMLLTFLGKGVCAVFYAGCLLLVRRLAVAVGLGQKAAAAAPLLVGLWPPLFFSVFVMGQYDIICLFFMLLGLCYYLENRMLPFALWFGVAIAVKSFPAFLFLPLLLLREKRPLHIAKYGVCALWLLVPTSLLYYGVTFSKQQFDGLMLARLFAARLPFAREVPVFPLVFLLLCIGAYFWRPAQRRFATAVLYVGLCCFGLLFLFVEWHPQWMVLLAPFAVLTNLQSRRMPWWLSELILYAGFFLVCAAAFPQQLEANLLDGGMLGLLGGARGAGATPLIDRYAAVPALAQLPTALFSTGLLAQLALKLPLPGGSVAARLWGDEDTTLADTPEVGEAELAEAPALAEASPGKSKLSYVQLAWVLFGVGFGVFFLLPALAGWVVG